MAASRVVGGKEWAENDEAALKLALPRAVELNLVQRGNQSTTGDSKVPQFFLLRRVELRPLTHSRHLDCDLI